MSTQSKTLTFPTHCPSCQHPRAHLRYMPALSAAVVRLGFDVSKALKAAFQATELWRCAMCGCQFDKTTHGAFPLRAPGVLPLRGQS